MTLFYKKKKLSAYDEVLELLEGELQENTFGDRTVTETLNSVVSMESLSTEQTQVLGNQEERMERVFADDKIDDLLHRYAGVNLEDASAEDKRRVKPLVDQAKLAMTTAAFATGAPKAYMERALKPEQARQDHKVLGDAESHDSVVAMEGFDNFDFDEFRAKSILNAGIAVVTAPFAPTWFKPVNVPNSQSGIDIEINVPVVYNRQYRGDTGKEYKLRKTSIVDAPLDHTILENNLLEVVPVSKSANSEFLVDPAKVQDTTVTLGGEPVKTRPIAYGKSVNLIGISTTDELVKTGTQDERDTLDPVVSIGKQYVYATFDSTNKGAIVADVSFMAGALLNNVAEGKQPNKSTSFTGAVWVNGNDELVGGAKVSSLGIHNALAIAEDVPMRLKLNVRLHATLEHYDANMTVDAPKQSFEVVEIQYGAKYESRLTAGDENFDKVVAKLDLEPQGYWPDARRSNSNMRQLGTAVDKDTEYKFRLSVAFQPPISALKPVNQTGNGISMDTLGAIGRLRDMGTAASTILDFERRLQAVQDLDNSFLTIGDVLVKPTYLRRKLDVSEAVRTISSKDGLDDLRNQIVNALTMLSNETIIESGYRNALAVYTGNRDNFDTNLLCDPLVNNLIMTSGDGRTLGNGRRFTTSEIDDRRFRNRVYGSFSRTDVSGVDPLNFGAFLTSPSMIYKATTTKGGAVSGETQLVPRNRFYVTLPILFRLDIQGLEGYFVNMSNA